MWLVYDEKGRLESESSYVKNIKEGGFIEYDTLKILSMKAFIETVKLSNKQIWT